MAANSGIVWIDFVFDECVNLLYVWADMLGITYEEINVWLFVVIGPALLVLSIGLNLVLLRQRLLSRDAARKPAALAISQASRLTSKTR